MNILLVTEFFPSGNELVFSGGVEARNFFMAKNLVKLGHNVTVLASFLSGQKLEEDFNKIKIIRVHPKRDYFAKTGDFYNRLNFLFNAIEIGKKIDCDLVEGTNFLTHFIAKEISKRRKIPVVFWYPDVWIGKWLENTGVSGVLGEILERVNIYRGADYFISISNETKKKLKEFIKGRIATVYCGVDIDEFKQSKDKFEIPTVISVARFVAYKNQSILLYALRKILDKGINCNLILVGVGPDETRLRNICSKLGLDNKVSFYSKLPRNDLVNLVKRSHIFSLPSFVEGFGIATIEAAAAGIPYVNSNLDVQREITRDGIGGFLVNPKNADDFTDKILTLIREQKLYTKKSIEAKRLASYYDWKILAKQTEIIYKEVLKI